MWLLYKSSPKYNSSYFFGELSLKLSLVSSQQNVPSFEEIQRMEEEKENQARVICNTVWLL